MDCRKALGLVLLLVTTVGATGCTALVSQQARTPTTPGADGEPIAHKASTYVAFAEFRAGMGFSDKLPPEQQEQCRKEAQTNYQKALEVEPNCLPAHIGLARLLSAWEKHNDAAAAYTKAISLAGTEAGLWYELGMCQCRQKDWAAAVNSLNRSVQLAPTNRQYKTHLGLTLARSGRPDDALKQLREVRGEAQAHHDLARIYAHLNQPALARKHAEQAVALDPTLAKKPLREAAPASSIPPPVPATAPALQQVGYNQPVTIAPVPEKAVAQVVSPRGDAEIRAPAPVVTTAFRKGPTRFAEETEQPAVVAAGETPRPIPVPPMPVLRIRSSD